MSTLNLWLRLKTPSLASASEQPPASMGNLPPPAPGEMVVVLQRGCCSCAGPNYEVPDSLKKFLSEFDVASMNRQLQMMDCIAFLCSLVCAGLGLPCRGHG